MADDLYLAAPRSEAELCKLEKLYLESFPPEERRSWEAIVAPAEDGCPRLRAIYADGSLAGLVTTWELADAVYVEHLATDPALRGRGIGEAAVRALVAEAAPRGLLLEVEPESADNPMAARRIGFYRRCGLDLLPYDYVQPPYGPGLPWVELRLMSSDSRLDAASAAAELHCRVYEL